MKYLILLFAILTFSSCTETETESTYPHQAEGLKPIYVKQEDLGKIKALPPQDIRRLGKILYKTPYIFAGESGMGFHVIDNSDPSNPMPISFFQIPGCKDISIKGDRLYAESLDELVTIDISNLDSLVILNRIANVYERANETYPDGYTGFFECVDPEKGVVVDWVPATLENPKCRK